MGCMPSSIYPEHIQPTRGVSTVITADSVHSTRENGHSREVSFVPTQAKSSNGQVIMSSSKANAVSSRDHFSGSAPEQPLMLRVKSQGDVGADGVGLASTTYTTSNGTKHKFRHGRPVGFYGAEDIIPCLDETGMQGNLYRLVRSKLISIGEEENVADDGLGDNTDTLSESEAKEREQGMDLVATSVTARRNQRAKTAETELQEQYVVALLGTDVIADTSAVPPSRRRVRSGPLSTSITATSPSNQATAAAATPQSVNVPHPPPNPRPPASNPRKVALHADEQHAIDWDDDTDYQLFPQDHYSALPAQRKPGAAVPVAFCPRSRTLRVPVKYSAVEDRVMTNGSGTGKWTDKMKPQRVFRLATSETRTWAFYNDSEYVMHVFALFDGASKLEPRDSTRLWPSSVFDDGNEAPTPPPFFFGLFFDDEGEEVVPSSEFPDSSPRRHQQVFGARGMWLAELLIPPRSTRLFVEGKVRGAYRMRCTRLDIDDLVTMTASAQSVAQKRNAKNAAERFSFAPRRQGRPGSSGKRLSGSARLPAATESSSAKARAAASSPTPLSQCDLSSPAPPPSGMNTAAGGDGGSSAPAAARASALTSTESRRRKMQGSGSGSALDPHGSELSSGGAGLPAVSATSPGGVCYSTVAESQGVLTRQTYLRHRPARNTAEDEELTTPPSHAQGEPNAAAVSSRVVNPLAPRSPPSPQAAAAVYPVESERDHRASGAAAVSPSYLLPALPPTRMAPRLARALPLPVAPPVASSVREVVSVGAGAETGLRALPAEHRTPKVEETPAVEPTAPPAPVAAPVADAAPAAELDGTMRSSATASSKRTHELPPLGPPHVASAATLPPQGISEEGEPGEDEEGEDVDCLSDTESTCTDFAKVRPGRQRPASTRDDDAFTTCSSAVTHEASDEFTKMAAHRALLPQEEQASLKQSTVEQFSSDFQNSSIQREQLLTSPLNNANEGPWRLAPPRTPAQTSTSSGVLSPSSRLGKRRGTPTSGVAPAAPAPAGAAERSLSPETNSLLPMSTWVPRAHTLTPQTSFQSGPLGRPTIPSVSSCRTVVVDDSMDSFANVAQRQENTAVDTHEHTLPPQHNVAFLEKT